MKLNDLIFINEQLAELVKTGIPLEGALKQTSKDLSRGKYKSELEALGTDLARGTPFEDAVKNRDFPEFYRKMLIIGAKADNLPEIFNNVADYYRKKRELKIKISHLMFYPIMVFMLFSTIFLVLNAFCGSIFRKITDELLEGEPLPFISCVAANLNVFLITVCLIIAGIWILLQSNKLQWKISPYREANAANLCSMMSLCLKNGLQLPETLELLANVDENPMLSSELKKIHQRICQGDSVTEAFASCRLFPDILSWMLNSFEDNPEVGFSSAKEIFYSRSTLKTEVLLNLLVPSSIILLGFLTVIAVMGYFGPLISVVEKLGG